MSDAEHTLRVRFYAILRESVGRDDALWTTRAATPAALFAELRMHHRWTWSHQSFRAAVNNVFCGWDHPLKANDEVAFIPPVAGG